MFVRQKKNKSGTVSIQIIDKSSGKYKVRKTIGSSSGPKQIRELIFLAESYILNFKGQRSLDLSYPNDDEFYNRVYESIERVQLLGPELVLGKIYDQIGFNQIEDDLFRYLVITRLIYPSSKLKTIDYLQKYMGLSYDKDKIYRYLDKLHAQQIVKVQNISYEHTLRVIGHNLSVVFYDVTTLYFEAEDEDDLRKMGFSKDGKHQNPQIVLGLLVSFEGYPLDYEIFQGNKFEGHTMLPVIDSFRKRYGLKQLIVVADAGMMSNKNLKEIIAKDYKFIIGARIKNEVEDIKRRILELRLDDLESISIQKQDGLRLIVSYSDSRAKKDKHNRDKGLKKLEKSVESGKLSKKHINNRGYNKYLKLIGEIEITIDYEKYEQDAAWDGLKGYITNSDITKELVIDHYKQLWNVEKTFRISKTDLRIRPIFHYRQRRIEAHICIAFAACKIYKELERQLKNMSSELSSEKVINILKTIFGITLILPESKKRKMMLLDKTYEQKEILQMFNVH